MKLYVLPVERDCNADCGFCITKIREKNGTLCDEGYLKISDLEKSLERSDISKIEITGGGEPTLHPEIEEIIEICSKRAKTQMYTNGELADNVRNLEALDVLCISRAHYDDSENKRIMAISYDISPLAKRVPLKLSLMLYGSGISEPNQFNSYIDWANSIKSKKVVVREMFNLDYGEKNSQFVSIVDFFSKLNLTKYNFSGRNPIYRAGDMEVEFEFPEMTLHADGKLRRGWRDEI